MSFVDVTDRSVLDLEKDTSGSLGVEGVVSPGEATSGGGGPVLVEEKEEVETTLDLLSSSAFGSRADS